MNPPVRHLTIIAEEAGERLDQFLCKKFPERTRSYFNRLIRSGAVWIKGEKIKSGYIVKDEDQVYVEFIEEKIDLSPQNIPIEITYEDQDILVVNKPSGLIVHPGKGSGSETLVNALLYHVKHLSKVNQDYRPGIVHRLDKNTSGLLIVAKNDNAHLQLQQQFLTKSIKRQYYALVWGAFKQKEGTVTTGILRSRKDPTKMAVNSRGKSAITHYTVLQEFDYMTLLKVNLESGRTHQIRVHMNHIHHPVVGDPDYNGRDSQLKTLPPNLKKRGIYLLKMLSHQFLHAKILEFVHPTSGKSMKIEIDLPEELRVILGKLPRWFLQEV